jgi:hypothetical protein
MSTLIDDLLSAEQREICVQEVILVRGCLERWHRAEEWDSSAYLGLAFSVGCTVAGAFFGIGGVIVGAVVGAAGSALINAGRHREMRDAGNALQVAIQAFYACFNRTSAPTPPVEPN